MLGVLLCALVTCVSVVGQAVADPNSVQKKADPNVAARGMQPPNASPRSPTTPPP